jgi:hypothetical protein
VFQIVFNHKQFENKKTGLKIEGVSDCCFTPNELFQLYHGENRLLKVEKNAIVEEQYLRETKRNQTKRNETKFFQNEM